MYFEYSSTLRKEFIPKSVLIQLFSKTSIKLYTAVPEVKKYLLNKQIVVTIIGVTRMKKLNKEFRGKHKSTDVLTFEYHESDIAGEMFLSVDDIRRNAVYLGHSFQEEFIEIFVHGLLHMAGVKHGDYMFKKQVDITKEILKTL